MFYQKPVEDFIGKGITLPIELDNGRAVIKSGFDLIRSSLVLILSWPKFSRFYLEQFGNELGIAIEEPNDPILQRTLQQFITDAINQWENRIELVSVNTITTPTSISIGLKYRLINTQQEDSFIFPFYTKIIY